MRSVGTLSTSVGPPLRPGTETMTNSCSPSIFMGSAASGPLALDSTPSGRCGPAVKEIVPMVQSLKLLPTTDKHERISGKLKLMNRIGTQCGTKGGDHATQISFWVFALGKFPSF